MSNKTTNYLLIKPESTDNYDIEDQNSNMDLIDGELKAINDFKEHIIKYPKATGTGTGILVTTGLFKLEDGNAVTFIASVDNAGQTTTLNVDNKGAKPIYKLGTVVAPSIKAGKAITVWYDLEHACFFIKASAEGNTTAESVLAGKIFSNDDDTGLVGSMPNIGNVGELDLSSQGQSYEIPKGYHDGQGKVKATLTNLTGSVIKSGSTVGGVQGTFSSDANAQAGHVLSGATAYVNGSKITGTIPSKAAALYTPSTSNQTITANQYLAGDQTIAGDLDLISANIKSGANIFGVTGSSNVVDTSAGDATASQILSGKKAYVDGALVTGTIPIAPTYPVENEAGQVHCYSSPPNPNEGNHNLFLQVPKGYYDNNWLGARVANLNAENIKTGVVLGDDVSITGTFTSDATATSGHILAGQSAYVKGNKVNGSVINRSAENVHQLAKDSCIYSTNSSNYGVYLLPPEGYYNGQSWTWTPTPMLISSNIRAGVSIWGVNGSSTVVDTADATAAATTIAQGNSAYVKGIKVDGTIPVKTGDNIALTVEKDSAGNLLLSPSGGCYNYLVASKVYASNAQIKTVEPNLIPSSIINTASIFNVQGTAKKLSMANGTIMSSSQRRVFTATNNNQYSIFYVSFDFSTLTFIPQVLVFYQYSTSGWSAICKPDYLGPNSATVQSYFYQYALPTTGTVMIPVDNYSNNHQWIAVG